MRGLIEPTEISSLRDQVYTSTAGDDAAAECKMRLLAKSPSKEEFGSVICKYTYSKQVGSQRNISSPLSHNKYTDTQKRKDIKTFALRQATAVLRLAYCGSVQ